MAKQKYNSCHLLTNNCWQSQQSSNYEALWELNGERIRVNIRCDHYSFQSYARASIFDPARRCWNFLVEIPYPDMVTSPRACSTLEYAEDEGELMKKVEMILPAPKKNTKKAKRSCSK